MFLVFHYVLIKITSGKTQDAVQFDELQPIFFLHFEVGGEARGAFNQTQNPQMYPILSDSQIVGNSPPKKDFSLNKLAVPNVNLFFWCNMNTKPFW